MRVWIKSRSGGLLLAAFCALLGLSAMRAMDEPDIWFQLLAGRFALDAGSVPHVDFIGYVAADSPQAFGGWGFGALYELAIRAFGFPAASWLNAWIWGACFACALGAGRARAASCGALPGAWGAAAAALAVCALWAGFSSRMGMRAESVLVLAWCACAWLGESSIQSGRPWRFWIALPLAAWGLSWLHTGGFLLLTLAGLMFLRDGGFCMPSARLRGWALCLAAAALLPLANPNGAVQAYGQLGSIVDSLASGASADAKASGQAYNLEYLPIWSPESLQRLPAFAGLFMLAMCAFSRGRRPGSRMENLVVAIFLAMAAARSRGVGLAAMALAAPALEAALRGQLGPVGSLAAFLGKALAKKPKSSLALAWACAAGLACLPLAWSLHSGSFKVQGRKAGGEAVAAAIKQALPNGGAIYSSETGYQLQYLMGGSYKVAPIAHELVFNPAAQAHYRALLGLSPGYEAELAKVDAVCLPLYLPMPGRGYLYDLPGKLAGVDGWRYVELGGWPCDLFVRVAPGQALDNGQKLAQRVAYLKNLAALANLSASLMDDAYGERLAGSALEQAKRLQSLSKAMSPGPAR